jgi:hypothetical protein
MVHKTEDEPITEGTKLGMKKGFATSILHYDGCNLQHTSSNGDRSVPKPVPGPFMVLAQCGGLYLIRLAPDL